MDLNQTEVSVDAYVEDKSHSNEEAESSRNHETAHFDPKLSSREMRKIKYYEDMFARMANENKQSSGHSGHDSGQSSKSRARVYDKKRSAESKHDDPQSSAEMQRHDSLDSTHSAGSKSSRRSVYKKTVQPVSLEQPGLKQTLDASRAESAVADGKTLLDNKRLIRVQSMPMVTKKPKVVQEPVETKPAAESRSASRRSRVSRWDVKTSFSAHLRDGSASAEGRQPKSRSPDAKASASVKQEHKAHEPEAAPTTPPTEEPEPTHAPPTQAPEPAEVESDFGTYHDSRDLPLDVDDFLNEDSKEDSSHDLDLHQEHLKEQPDPGLVPEDQVKQEVPDYAGEEGAEQAEEGAEVPPGLEPREGELNELDETLPLDFEPKEEDQDMLEDQTPAAPSRKKSTRGRRSKTKRSTPTSTYAPEPADDSERPTLDEEYTPASLQPEFYEDPKPASRTRTKSQRNKKKKQEYYEGERPPPRSKQPSKSSKVAAKGQAAASEKSEKAHTPGGKREPEPPEEKFISVDNLRMITVEEAEKMLNLCTKRNTELEEVKRLIESISARKSPADMKSRVPEMNLFLLDPSNIVAPSADLQPEPLPPVPENPLEISFKFRLFQGLNNV